MLHDLKQAIAEAGGKIRIVEGEPDVWSLHAMDIRQCHRHVQRHQYPKRHRFYSGWS